ncbi:DUF7544 domain-containing protein [Haladaptatus caseinilyticus]|uniref:DUF7544 domain-containing protein n=1 Tax=Haladaptatus caseinilyticus TaxID=2993314 RepID=UPI00224B986A|nr:hypothetical protein [Haladaptatus caseinilyticus]
MPWYAVEALDDAIEATKELLLPVEVRAWLKLSIIVLFLGGTSISPPTGGKNYQLSGEFGGPFPDIPISMDTLITFTVAIVAVAILLWVVFAGVGSLMEFAFVESLRSQDVHVRPYLRRYFGQGLRLFGFRLVLFTLVLLPIVGFLLVFIPSILDGSSSLALGALFLFLPVVVVLGLFVGLVDGLTTNFVVPVMVLRGGGVVAGWRTFWPTLRREWKQYGVYVLLRFALSIAAGIAVSIVGGILSFVALIPFAIVAVGLYMTAGFPVPPAIVSNTPLLVSFGLVALLYILLLVFAFAVIRVPVQTYLRYFALLVLGDTNHELDLIPELREEVR